MRSGRGEEDASSEGPDGVRRGDDRAWHKRRGCGQANDTRGEGALPIVEGERPVGIVTDRDVIAHVVAEGHDPNSVTVDDIATRDLVVIGLDQDVEEARQLMAQHELDRILVVEGDQLVGIISEADAHSDERPLA